MNKESIDVSENRLRNRGRILDILLVSHVMRLDGSRLDKKNIIWATDSYTKHKPRSQMKREQITGVNGKLIQPRASKSKEEQKYRTKDKAEVFTPLSIVEQMNSEVTRNLDLPENHTWTDFVEAQWLEITCGEAPFIAGRYNPTANTGTIIEPHNRVGFLDRKLQVVQKHVTSKKDWIKYAEIALKSCYGYEWQGDNLLIARENVLLTMNDFYEDFCKNRLKQQSDTGLSTEQLEKFAEIIAWNIWQMDGLKYVEPMSCKDVILEPQTVPKSQMSLALNTGKPKKIVVECEGCRTNNPLKHTGRYSVIKDWQASKQGKNLRFVDLL